MTLREKYDALLADLIVEREQHGERFIHYYDRKIADLRASIVDRFMGGENANS